MAVIEIESMEFYAFHGHFREEQVAGNRFLVDVRLEVDTTAAQHSDELSDTVNYVHVYQIIKEQMAIKDNKVRLTMQDGRIIIENPTGSAG